LSGIVKTEQLVILTLLLSEHKNVTT